MNAPTTAPIKILLVDDLPENLLALSALLRRDGVELLQARSGSEALELLLVHPVALALVDVQMPEMDGFELAELMRGSERTRAVPIIFVTAGANDERRIFKGYEAGAVDFLYKPLDAHILTSKVGVFVELAQQRQALAHELSEKSETLRLHEMFTAMLGHDLRGPLSAIVMASILQEKKASDDATRRTAGRILASAKHMGRMIADMLDLARVRLAGGIPVRRQPTDLLPLAEQTIDEHRVASQSHRIAMTSFGDTTVDCDATRVAQLMSNLVGNAVEHGDPSAGIACELDGRAADHVRFSVRNAGAIDPALASDLFDPFRGRETYRSKGGGLGLGLYIVDQIARAHGGDVQVRSDADVTTFCVTLPRTSPGAPQGASQRSSRRAD